MIAILGTVLGVVGTLAGSTVSDWYTQQQYWREQRTAAYVAYSASLVEADNAVEALRTSITYAAVTGRARIDPGTLSAEREQLALAAAKLDETVAPVEAVGHDELFLVTRSTYLAQSARVDMALWQIDVVIPSNELTIEVQGDIFDSIDSADDTVADGNPEDFIKASRVVMGVD